MEEVPDNFIDRVISMNQYFKKIKCEPFFIHNRKTNMVEICLDIPNEEKVSSKTDYKYLV